MNYIITKQQPYQYFYVRDELAHKKVRKKGHSPQRVGWMHQNSIEKTSLCYRKNVFRTILARFHHYFNEL